MTELVHVVDGELVPVDRVPAARLGEPVVDDQLSQSAWERIAAGIPPNTVRAYRRLLFGLVDDRPAALPWPHLAYVPWCVASGRRTGLGDEAATEETLAEWVNTLADASIGAATIEQGLAAVRRLHTENGHPGRPGTARALGVLRGYRKGGAAQAVRRARPVTLPVLRAMLDTTPADDVRGKRDSLILVLGVAGMLRRSELAALRDDQVAIEERGLVVTIASSKTDKMATGQEVVIPRGHHPRTDVVRLLAEWREVLDEQGQRGGALLRVITPRGGVVKGPLHHTGVDVDRIVKAAALRAGLGDGWSAHGLRAGGATAAYLGGASIPEIMEQGRWSNPNQVVEYIRRQDRWIDNAAAKMGL